jgi:hypothetical protein
VFSTQDFEHSYAFFSTREKGASTPPPPLPSPTAPAVSPKLQTPEGDPAGKLFDPVANWVIELGPEIYKIPDGDRKPLIELIDDLMLVITTKDKTDDGLKAPSGLHYPVP